MKRLLFLLGLIAPEIWAETTTLLSARDLVALNQARGRLQLGPCPVRRDLPQSLHAGLKSSEASEFLFTSQTDYTASSQNPFAYEVNRFSLLLVNRSTGQPLLAGNGRPREFYGFWDGNRRWLARINFPQTGDWLYVTQNTMNDAALECRIGVARVESKNTGTLLSTNGYPLRFDPITKRLTYANGTPFFWLGDTWWKFPKGFQGEYLSRISNDRVQNGFTVIQTHGMNVPIEGTSAILATKSTSDAAIEYWRSFDEKVRAVHSAGLVLFLGYGSFAYFDNLEDQNLSAQDLRRMFFYSLARYGAFATNYLVTQEYNQYYQEDGSIFPPPQREARFQIIDSIGRMLKQYDPYERATALHFATARHSKMVNPAKNYPWVDFYILQGGHRKRPTEVRASLYQEFPLTKPFVEGELNWERFVRDSNPQRIWFPENGNDLSTAAFVVDSNVVGEAAATSYQAGALGFSYGAMGLFNSIERPQELASGNRWGPIRTMEQALSFSGPERLSLLKRIYQSVGWSLLKPLPAVLAEADRKHISVSGQRLQNEEYVLHFHSGRTILGELELSVDRARAEYEVQGISPRTGAHWLPPRNHVSSHEKRLVVEVPPEDQRHADFLMIVKRVATQ